MLSYKGDTLGEHMHAWPQDLTRAEGREGKKEGRGGYRLRRQQDEPIASRLDRDVDPRSDDGEQWLLNFKQVSRF